MSGFPWLTARPIAHRGLHDKTAGRIENAPAAAKAALAAGYGLECDVQLTADGEAVVFHDFKLDRLTAQSGWLRSRTAAQLGAVTLTGSQDTIPTLAAFLDLIGGAAPVVVEIKSAFDGDLTLARRVAEIVAGRTAVALKSFDPDVIAFLRAAGPKLGLAGVPLGIVAEAHCDSGEWLQVAPEKRAGLPHLLHYERTRPDFLSWRVGDLPHGVPHLFRIGLGLPVMTWTVRTQEERAVAGRFADQMVFEGFHP
ncbi:MAG: glycerophosphodiester phosphodiesterase [Hyphomicrobiales bacterium]|nr:glycerophosphodiester phosphodiesterase [Hyphomicrobiales bacterium]